MLLSFDSTIKANISVGPPIDFQIYETDSFHTGPAGRFHKDDPYLLEISNGWGWALKVAFDTMPNLSLILVKDKIKENLNSAKYLGYFSEKYQNFFINL